MSKRRKPGDWVQLLPHSGYVCESDRLLAQIQFEENPPPCFDDCGDDNCVEWTNLLTEPDPENNGKRWPLCHVSECLMSDPDREPLQWKGCA